MLLPFITENMHCTTNVITLNITLSGLSTDKFIILCTVNENQVDLKEKKLKHFFWNKCSRLNHINPKVHQLYGWINVNPKVNPKVGLPSL